MNECERGDAQISDLYNLNSVVSSLVGVCSQCRQSIMNLLYVCGGLSFEIRSNILYVDMEFYNCLIYLCLKCTYKSCVHQCLLLSVFTTCASIFF